MRGHWEDVALKWILVSGLGGFEMLVVVEEDLVITLDQEQEVQVDLVEVDLTEHQVQTD